MGTIPNDIRRLLDGNVLIFLPLIMLVLNSIVLHSHPVIEEQSNCGNMMKATSLSQQNVQVM